MFNGQVRPLSSVLENSASHKTFLCPQLHLKNVQQKKLKCSLELSFRPPCFRHKAAKCHKRKDAPLSPAFGDLASRKQTYHCLDLTPSLSGGRRVRPNLDLDVVGVFSLGLWPGTKLSASGLRRSGFTFTGRIRSPNKLAFSSASSVFLSA